MFIGGTAILSGNVTTTERQWYPNVVTLAADSIITTTTVVAGTDQVSFPETIDGAHSLTVVSDGTIAMLRDIGSATALTSLTVTGNGHVRLDDVRTTGPQNYNVDVRLRDSVTLEGLTLNFNRNLDGPGAVNLTVAGDAVFGDGGNDYVGRTNPLGTLSVSGSATINSAPDTGATISTDGNQTFNGPVTIVGISDPQLSSSGGAVSFSDRIDVENGGTLTRLQCQ